MLANLLPPPVFFDRKEAVEIKNNYFAIKYNKDKGTFDIYRSSGAALLTGGVICVNTAEGKLFSLSGNYKIGSESAHFSDRIGKGEKLIIYSEDRNKKLNFEVRLSLYDQFEGVTFEAICTNVSEQDLYIKSIEPVRVISKEGGVLKITGVKKCITDGVMYYDAGMIYDFEENKKISPGGLDIALPINTSVSPNTQTIRSWWNAGFFSGYDKEGLSIGYIDNSSALGNLLIAKTSPDQISFTAESVYAPQLLLKPGTSISSNRFMINIAENPYKALENYAEAMGKINNARTGSVINGWCSWFYTLANVSEDEVLRNVEFASQHLRSYGLEFIQIDEGYQKWHGEWEGNDRFPHGMKWLADKIKSYGFKAGLWISPYIISETTQVFKEHPDWLLKHPDGSLKRIGNWEGEIPDWAKNEYPKRYCLDITHPGAAKWLHDLFDTISNRWGYEMIKIDFMAWSILAPEQYYDRSVSSAQVYRRGLEIMRDGAGANCHILECGPGSVTIGLIDSMRIEADINYGFSEAEWKTYFQDPACSANAAAKRYYFHKRTWINDADHICMNLLTNIQSEAAATIIGLSGGNMISGDRLHLLDPYKLDVLKKITPSYGEAARPVDLFDSEMQSVFALNIRKKFGQWTIAGFFNPDLNSSLERKFLLSRFGLESGKTYLAFDFWKQKFMGEITGNISVTVPPGSVILLALHEKQGVPQFISTDRHILQGAVEIDNINWDKDKKILSGISKGPLNTSHNITIFIPEKHEWTWGGYVLFRDYDSYSLKLVEENLVRVTVNFEKSDTVNWEFRYDEFFGS
jgi:hypothetical protein